MPEGIVPLRPTERSFVGLRCPSGLLLRNVSASAIAGVTLTPMIGQTANMAKNKRKRSPKTVLKLPDLERMRRSVLITPDKRPSVRWSCHAPFPRYRLREWQTRNVSALRKPS
jgi:hypothetical protein